MGIFDTIKNTFTNEDEITKEIRNAKAYLEPRRQRIKEDIDKRYLLEKYIFKDLEGKEHKGINNVTLNDPRFYTDRTIAVLGTATRRFEVLNEDKGLSNSLEKLIEYLLIRSDENLAYQNIMELDGSLDFTACVEGTIAGRVILYRDGDNWYPEIMPLDPYSVIYVSGKRGCRVVSIESTRAADEIYRDYGIKVNGNTATIEDIWTVDQNIIKIDGKIANGYPVNHPLGMNPVIVVPCPTTPFLTSRTDAVKYQAESIYAGVRDMYDVLNREATGWSTQNWMGFLPPVYGVLNPGRKLPQMQYGLGAQISLENGESVQSWPIKDLSVAHQAYFGQIMARIQRATMSNVDYGDLSFELSALAIKRLESAKDQLFVPRLKAKKFFMVQVAYSLLKQYINGGYPVDLNGLGDKILDWKPEDFRDKNFVINVDYYAESPEENIADMTIANTALNMGLPPEWIYNNLLHLKDVPEVMRMRAREMAIKLSPSVAQYWCGQMLKDSPDMIDKGIAEILVEDTGQGVKEGVKNPPSQPAIPTGITMPPVSTPAKSAEEAVQREELRRQNIISERR